jgi:hypothetical protein
MGIEAAMFSTALAGKSKSHLFASGSTLITKGEAMPIDCAVFDG